MGEDDCEYKGNICKPVFPCPNHPEDCRLYEYWSERLDDLDEVMENGKKINGRY